MQEGSICFLIQEHLEPYSVEPLRSLKSLNLLALMNEVDIK